MEKRSFIYRDWDSFRGPSGWLEARLSNRLREGYEIWRDQKEMAWRGRSDDFVDAFLYAEEGRKWRVWFDSQPRWYRWFYQARRWLARQIKRFAPKED